MRDRNIPAARVVRPALASRETHLRAVLDVGCASSGLAPFIPGVRMVGLDTQVPARATTFQFVRGSGTALPFGDRAFTVVTCIDVLEHVPPSKRRVVISELVRVAQAAVVIACPHGETGRRCDEEFRRACEIHGRVPPRWIDEHQRHSYPRDSELLAYLKSAAAEVGRVFDVSLAFAEPRWVCRLVRAAAARSDLLYVATNLLFGAAYPAIPAPGALDGYRVILHARLSDEPTA